MTKLEQEVTRVTTITVDRREVDVTLRPADSATLDPETIVFHQKGMRSEVAVPVTAILKAIGWKPDGKISKVDRNAEFDALMTSLEAALAPWKQREVA